MPAARRSTVIVLFAAGLYGQSSGSRVEAIRFWSFGDITRIAIQTQGNYKLTSDQIDSPARLYFDLTGLRPSSARRNPGQTITVNDQRLRQIRVAEVSPGRTRIVFDLTGPVDAVSSQLVNPDRLIIEIRPKSTAKPPLEAVAIAPVAVPAVAPPPQISVTPRADSPMSGVNAVIDSKTEHKRPPAGAPVSALPAHDPEALSTSNAAKSEPAVFVPSSAPVRTSRALNRSAAIASPAKKDSTGDRSLVRVFGLKLGKVVIDAGHGGHDTGTIGPNGLMEKDLVLDVALRLGRLINQQLGAAVVFTRSEDVFIPLEDRTKIANDEKADMFISIHANSSPESTATGVETYYFNLSTDQSGLELATRENATSVSSISDLNDLLHKAVLKTKSEESREFAQNVQASLWGASVKMNSRSRDRGVRQAPFVVLIGATMPSILAEIGFVSNPHDEKLLIKSDQRQKIAEALFKGISQYASSLSHVQIARAGTNRQATSAPIKEAIATGSEQ